MLGGEDGGGGEGGGGEDARIRTGNPCHMDELSNSRCERGDDAIMQSVWCKPELAVVSSRKVGTCLTVNSCPRVLCTVHCVNSCPRATKSYSYRQTPFEIATLSPSARNNISLPSHQTKPSQAPDRLCIFRMKEMHTQYIWQGW